MGTGREIYEMVGHTAVVRAVIKEAVEVGGEGGEGGEDALAPPYANRRNTFDLKREEHVCQIDNIADLLRSV